MIQFGVTIKDFWEMTPDEMNVVTIAHNKNYKENIIRDYNIATMIATFVNCTMAGNDIPDIYDTFPDAFSDEEKDEAILKEMQEHMLKYVRKVDR